MGPGLCPTGDRDSFPGRPASKVTPPALSWSSLRLGLRSQVGNRELSAENAILPRSMDVSGRVRSLSFVGCPRAISGPVRALLVILGSSMAPLGPLSGLPVIYRREIRIIQYAW